MKILYTNTRSVNPKISRIIFLSFVYNTNEHDFINCFNQPKEIAYIILLSLLII